MNEVTLKAFPFKMKMSIIGTVPFALVMVFAWSKVGGYPLSEKILYSIVLVIVDLILVLAFYNAFNFLKVRKLFVKANQNGILINHINNNQDFFEWRDIEKISTQSIIPYLKPIPEVHVYLSVKLKNDSNYRPLNLKYEERFIKNNSAFDKYIGDKSFDIYISLSAFKDDENVTLVNFIEERGIKITVAKPIIKTNDNKIYEKLLNRYFTFGKKKDKDDNGKNNIVFMP